MLTELLLVHKLLTRLNTEKEDVSPHDAAGQSRLPEAPEGCDTRAACKHRDGSGGRDGKLEVEWAGYSNQDLKESEYIRHLV